MGAYFPYIPLYYADLGLGLAAVGWLSALTALVALVSAPAWGMLVDRRRQPRGAIATAALWSAGAAALLGLVREPALVALGVILLAAAASAIAPLPDTRTVELLGQAQPPEVGDRGLADPVSRLPREVERRAAGVRGQGHEIEWRQGIGSNQLERGVDPGLSTGTRRARGVPEGPRRRHRAHRDARELSCRCHRRRNTFVVHPVASWAAGAGRAWGARSRPPGWLVGRLVGPLARMPLLPLWADPPHPMPLPDIYARERHQA